MALATLEAVVVAPTFACTEFWLIPACVVRLGAGNSAVALLAILPLLAVAALVPVVVPWTRNAGASRRVLSAFCVVQALLLGGLALPMHWPQAEWALPLAIGLIIGVVVSGACAGTAWLSLMATVVPPRIQGRYTTSRLRLFLLVKLAAALAFAGVLEVLPLTGGALGFDLILAVAVLGRLGSAAINARLLPTTDLPPGNAPLTLRLQGGVARGRGGWRAALASPFGRWTLAWATIHFGVAIAGPFFAPYMLAAAPAGLALAAAPMAYGLLMQTSQVLRLLCLPVVGRLIDRLGAMALLRLSLIGVTLIPLAWALTDNYAVLLAAEVVSGVVWCIAECAVAVLLMDPGIPAQRRSLLIAIHQTVTSLLVVAGTMAGAVALSVLPELDGSTYRSLFLLSMACRVPGVVVALVLLPRLRSSLLGSARELWGAFAGALGAGSIGRGLGRFLRRPEG